MESVEISNEVPFPAEESHGNSRYPFAKMEVGESFHVREEGEAERRRARARLSVAVNGHKIRMKAKGEERDFACRIRTGLEEGETAGPGVRVWRVK